jgi:hypothetical protein
MPLSIFAMMDSVMTLPGGALWQVPARRCQRRVGALRMADPLVLLSWGACCGRILTVSEFPIARAEVRGLPEKHKIGGHSRKDSQRPKGQAIPFIGFVAHAGS